MVSIVERARGQDTVGGERSRPARGVAVDIVARVLRHPTGGVGLIVIALASVLALLAPVVAPYDPFEQRYREELIAPGQTYWFGTDEFGRDIFSRILYGARISLGVSIVAVSISSLIGIPTGLMTGYLGGRFDAIVMRVWDCVLAFPSILLGIAVMAVLGPSSMNAALAVAIINMPVFARVTRAAALVEKGKTYVEAARALGAPDARIIFLTIFPNCLAPILVQVTVAAAFAILLEASLSFLGLGAQPPQPSWGTMLNTGRNQMFYAPWYGIFPGASIMLLILAFNFVADALRDALDPGRRREE